MWRGWTIPGSGVRSGLYGGPAVTVETATVQVPAFPVYAAGTTIGDGSTRPASAGIDARSETITGRNEPVPASRFHQLRHCHLNSGRSRHPARARPGHPVTEGTDLRLNMNVIIRRRTDPPASSGARHPLIRNGRPFAHLAGTTTVRQHKNQPSGGTGSLMNGDPHLYLHDNPGPK